MLNRKIPTKILCTKRKKNKWSFEILIRPNSYITNLKIIVKKREEDMSINIPHKLLKKRDFYKVYFEIDLMELPIKPGLWDFYVNINNEINYRINNPYYRVYKKINKRLASTCTRGRYLCYPYLTVKGGLSLNYREKGKYDSPKYIFKEKIALFIYYCFKLYWDKKNIWLINEKFSNTAQDNSYFFFKYCMENKLCNNLFYVINKEANDYKNLEKYDKHVIDFMSIKHIIYLLASKFLISSESRAHSYIWKEYRGKVKKVVNKKKHVFLQHGVIGLKKVDSIFKKGLPNGTDLFFASSEYEKEIIMKNFNYNSEEIIISGLSRWDFIKNIPSNSRKILLFPTWRTELDNATEEEFLKSKFFLQYKHLISSPQLHNLLDQNNIRMTFCIHPRINDKIKYFISNSPLIQITKHNELKINELIMESSLLITDYSSVSWDMFYLGKPVIFFQTGSINSYMNLDFELFGDRCTNYDELFNLLSDYIKNDFKEKVMYGVLRERYFKFIDKNNSYRIYKGIKNKEKQLSKSNSITSLLKDTYLYKGLRNRLS